LTGDSCEGGEELLGGVGVEEPEVLTLPTLISENAASSLVPSTMPSVCFVSGGEDLADPNCSNISNHNPRHPPYSGYLQSSTYPPVPDMIATTAMASPIRGRLAWMIELQLWDVRSPG